MKCKNGKKSGADEESTTRRRLRESFLLCWFPFAKKREISRTRNNTYFNFFPIPSPGFFCFLVLYICIFKFTIVELRSGESRRLPGQKKNGSGLDEASRLGAEKLLSRLDRPVLSHDGVPSDDLCWQMLRCQANYRLSRWNCELELLGLGWWTGDGVTTYWISELVRLL